MQNQSNLLITFGTQLKTALVWALIGSCSCRPKGKGTSFLHVTFVNSQIPAIFPSFSLSLFSIYYLETLCNRTAEEEDGKIIFCDPRENLIRRLIYVISGLRLSAVFLPFTT